MKSNIRRAAILAFWLLLWQAAALVIDNQILLPGPIAVFRALLGLLPTGNFWLSLLTSLLRIGGGFLLAFAVAAFLAALSFTLPLFRELLKPLVAAAKTVPIASFVILLLIWTSSRYLSTAISFLVVLPQLYEAMLAGLAAADQQLLEAAEVLRIPALRRFWFIYRPTLRGYLTAACSTALGMCWKSGVAAEVIGVPTGTIGEGFYLAKINVDIPSLLAWTVAMLCLSQLFEKLIMFLLHRFFRTVK